jgi:hypothetical protein
MTLGSPKGACGDDHRRPPHRLVGPGSAIGSAVLTTLLLSSPFLGGASYRHWLIGLAVGVALGLYFYVRRDRYSEPGPDADEQRFPH